MTTDDTGYEWEDEMGAELQRRVRDVQGAPLSLDSIKATAATIQRRRRAAVVGGIVGIAAAVTPIAVLVVENVGPSGNVGPASQPPSVAGTDMSPSAIDGGLSGVGVDYLEVLSGRDKVVLHRADGATVELPDVSYTLAADLGPVVAAYRQDGEANGLVDLVEDGTVIETYNVRAPMVVTPTASAVGFITSEGEYVVIDREGEEASFGSEFTESVVPAALIGDGDCYVEGGCEPFFEDGTGQQAPFEIGSGGSIAEVAGPDAISMNDAADGLLVTVQTASSVGGSCGSLVDRSTKEHLFDTCEFQPKDISPDGEHVTAVQAYGDGPGDLFVAILDRTGTETGRYAPEQGFIAETGWVDDTHAVATVYDGGSWQLVSIGIDGRIETLVGPVLGTSDNPPLRLAGAH